MWEIKNIIDMIRFHVGIKYHLFIFFALINLGNDSVHGLPLPLQQLLQHSNDSPLVRVEHPPADGVAWHGTAQESYHSAENYLWMAQWEGHFAVFAANEAIHRTTSSFFHILHTANISAWVAEELKSSSEEEAMRSRRRQGTKHSIYFHLFVQQSLSSLCSYGVLMDEKHIFL